MCDIWQLNFFFPLAFSFQAETLHQVNYSLAELSATSEQLASEDVPPTKVTQSWNVFILKQMTRSFDYCSMLREDGGGICVHLTFLRLAPHPNYTLLSCIVCCLFQGLDN